MKSRNITISNEMPDLYVVSGGLSENDKILIEGVQKVKEDDKVKTEYVASNEVISRLKLYAE